MMTRRLTSVVAALLAVSALTAAPALAAYPNSANGVLRDCGAGHDPLVGHYSISVLRKALHELHTNSLQYTTCADAIENAIHLDSLKPRPGKPPVHSGRVTKSRKPVVVRPNQPQIKQHLHNLQSEGGQPVTLPTGQTVTPGAVTTRSASFLSGLPTPLIVVLAALLAAVVAVGGRALQNVVRTRRSR